MSDDYYDRINRRGRYSRDYLARQGPHYIPESIEVRILDPHPQERITMDHKEKVRKAINELLIAQKKASEAAQIARDRESEQRQCELELIRCLKNYGANKKVIFQDVIYSLEGGGLVQHNVEAERLG